MSGGLRLAAAVGAHLLVACAPAALGAQEAVRAEERLGVDGAELFLETRGADRRAPVLLWLHGGPGGAERPLFHHFNGGLEDHFVVAYWDQRGAGRSFDPEADPSQLTIARHLADLDAVVDHLRRGFGRERIALVGHSWGGALGLLYARAHPEKVSALVGVAPLVSTRAGQRAEFDFVLGEALRSEDEDALARLREIGAPPYAGAEQVLALERLCDRYGGVFHQAPNRAWLLVRGIFGGLVTPWEIPRLIRGNEVSLEAMHAELQSLDLRQAVPGVDVPVAFLLGRFDRHVDAKLAAAYLEALRAPSKRLLWFERSAHNVPFEEPERFDAAVLEVLNASPIGSEKPEALRELLVSPVTMADPTFNELLVTALQTLAARPLANRKDLAAWRREADRLEESFTPEQADTVPDFVWHYLADADIRLRNSGFRADQERRLQQVFRELGPGAHKPVPRRRH
jgi:pimeloyl-ACP methyl ester carboxylesterase